MSGPLGVLIALTIAVIIAVLAILLKGRKGPLTTQAPDIDPKNPTNQPKNLHKKMQAWVIENWLVFFAVLGLVVLAPIAWHHVAVFAFLGGMVAGSVFGWLVPAFCALAVITVIVWAVNGSGTARKVATVGIVLCIALGGLFWWSGHPLYHETAASSEQSDYVTATSGVLYMPANGDTKHIVLKAGQVASLTGYSFTTYVKYANGGVCTLWGAQNPTCAGAIIEEWGHDISGAPNNVSFVVS